MELCRTYLQEIRMTDEHSLYLNVDPNKMPLEAKEDQQGVGQMTKK